MVTSIYLTILIVALVVLAHLALLYLVIRLAITHALLPPYNPAKVVLPTGPTAPATISPPPRKK
jgi:hypothetical protein